MTSSNIVNNTITEDIFDTDWQEYTTARLVNACNLVRQALGKNFPDNFPPVPPYFVNAIIAHADNPKIILEIWDLLS